MADLASAALRTPSAGSASASPARLATVASPVWPTESVRLRAVAPDAVSGPAGVLRLLGSARPADVPHALAALTTDQLTEAVATAELPLAPAVVAYLSQQGPGQACRMLVRRLVEQPEHVPPRPLAVDAYLHALTEPPAVDYRFGAVASVRALALEALCAGALSPEQVVEHTRPAALTLALAVCTPAEYLRPWIRRATGDVRVLLARRLREDLGDDHKRWAGAIDLSSSFAGTFAELLCAAEGPVEPRPVSPTGQTNHAPENVLLALAPRGVADCYLAGLSEPPRTGGLPVFAAQWGWMLSSGPLSRALVDHVVAHGSARQLGWLMVNELCPDRILENAQSGHLKRVLFRKIIPPHVGSRMFRALDRRPGGVRAQATIIAGGPDRLVDLAWSLTDAPTVLHQVVLGVLDRAVHRPGEDTLTCLYGALAHAAGPEIVWALELDRVGKLEDVMPPVRASMAAGSAEPLVEAAGEIPRRHWIDVLDDEFFGCQMLRAEGELDRTGHFSLEGLVAAQLDGRPERWSEVARRVAGSRMPVAEAIKQAIAGVAAQPATSASST